MWWSCFSWHAKGPYYIWEEETKAEKAACKQDIIDRNTERLESDIAKWEAVHTLGRLHATELKQAPGLSSSIPSSLGPTS
jgi:hypothetical protein